MEQKIIWTEIDEAPALATYSLLPIVNAFTNAANVSVEKRDISLSGRIISTFPEFLTEDQKQNDELAYLGELVETKTANIIKLPNISASIPQLKAAIKELQDKGYALPNYPEYPSNEEEKALNSRYAKCLGSAVNPVLRQGNSDRRVAPSVKQDAMRNPKKLGAWTKESNSHVAWMKQGDFFDNEKSITLSKEEVVNFEFIDKTGKTTLLKENLKLQKDEVLDASFMSIKALRSYIEEEIKDAKEKDLLFSVHLKATMMKVSDPIIFGQFVSVFYKDVFTKHADTFNKIDVNPDLGLGDLLLKIEQLPENLKAEIKTDIQTVYETNPALAMVDSDKGITNLHASNDIIIDASMPVVIRDSGKMWNHKGELQETKALIPDRSYSRWYQEAIDFCKIHGAFDPKTMGNVSNVGLMAQKAEEYGSHDKTFKAQADGTIRIVNKEGTVVLSHEVEEGDIYRACQVKDLPIKDWVRLAVSRAETTGNPAIFWLDKNRAHDQQLIKKVELYLKDNDTESLDIQILSPVEAMKFTLPRIKEGKDTISVTGNALRDYITDLFPILELGTSAKMLSIVPLLKGGGLFETGAGGSAPKHVQQFIKEGHLRWDSLGEFLALTVSLEHLAKTSDNKRAQLLADTLDQGISEYLINKKAPSRKAGELDNRGTHFYLAMYWAEALSQQTKDAELHTKFSKISLDLKNNEANILSEIAAAEGKATELGGYYKPKPNLLEKAMRPSDTLNRIIDNI